MPPIKNLNKTKNTLPFKETLTNLPRMLKLNATAQAPKPYLLPAVTHPLLVLPGVLGSWPPALPPRGKLDPITHVYDNLLNGLETIGYRPGLTLFPFPYNWRLPVRDLARHLHHEINRIKKLPAAPGVDYSKVDLICHSMGGLIARAYIQSDFYAQDVRKLVMVATPQQGSLAAYPAYEAGDSTWIGIPVETAQAMARLAEANESPFRKRAVLTYRTLRRQDMPDLRHYIQSDLHAIRDLLPLRAKKYLYKLDENGQEELFPFGCPENPLLEELNQPEILDRLNALEEIICLYSSTEKTPVRIKVEPSKLLPLYEHGAPAAEQPPENYEPGDAIVPVYSAQLNLPGARVRNEDTAKNLIGNLNHVQIIGDPAPVRHMLGYFVRPEVAPLTEAIFDGPLLANMKPNFAPVFL